MAYPSSRAGSSLLYCNASSYPARRNPESPIVRPSLVNDALEAWTEKIECSE